MSFHPQLEDSTIVIVVGPEHVPERLDGAMQLLAILCRRAHSVEVGEVGKVARSDVSTEEKVVVVIIMSFLKL